MISPKIHPTTYYRMSRSPPKSIRKQFAVATSQITAEAMQGLQEGLYEIEQSVRSMIAVVFLKREELERLLSESAQEAECTDIDIGDVKDAIRHLKHEGHGLHIELERVIYAGEVRTCILMNCCWHQFHWQDSRRVESLCTSRICEAGM